LKRPVHEKITTLLETEHENIKNLIFEAVRLAHTRRLPAEALAIKLHQQLGNIIRVAEHDN